MKYLEELKMYESGQTEAQIAEKFGVKRGTIQFRLKAWRDRDILVGNHKYQNIRVHWEKVDIANLPQSELSDTTDAPHSEVSGSAEIPQSEVRGTARIPQEAVDNTTNVLQNAFTAEEVRVLKEMVQRELHPPQKRSGEMVQTSVRLDSALWGALKEQLWNCSIH